MKASLEESQRTLDELEDHLREGVAFFLSKGVPIEDAFLKASTAIGDPKAIAAQFGLLRKESFPMKTMNRLKTWNATERIAGWLAILGIALTLFVIVAIVIGKENRLGEVVTPLLFAVLCLVLRNQLKKRIREIQAAHSP